jgi:hypothetical protein
MLIRSNVGILQYTLAITIATSPAAASPGDSFSYAVIADPHVSGGPDSSPAQRLQQAVDWVNAHRDQENIDLVFVVGDIGWSGNAVTAKSILDGLDMPYAPVIGDDEIAAGAELEFRDTFEPVYQSLEAMAGDPGSGFSNWTKAPGPVWNPDIGDWSTFQNFAFDYRGVHFVGLDWVLRDMSIGIGEEAELHDFAGGTFPWFTNYVETCSKDKQENIVMFAHHPMLTLGGEWGEILAALGAFAPGEFQQLSDFLTDPAQDYGNYVYAAYTGHFHSQGYLPEDADPNNSAMSIRGYEFDPNDYDPNGPIQLLPLPGYDLYIIDDTHIDPPSNLDDPISLELVTVTEGLAGFSYDSRAIIVPEPVTAALLFLAAGIYRGRPRRTVRPSG